jgi:hypothetical protein
MHIIIHNEAGEIRNKYRPVTDFVRVVSVGACPKPMTVDTPVRSIPAKMATKRFASHTESRE